MIKPVIITTCAVCAMQEVKSFVRVIFKEAEDEVYPD
jgi:hypothetical protein